jgi:hypothetical protein
MPEESFPILIGGKPYALRFEAEDVEKIEEVISLFEAFHPHYRTYRNAAVILWRGLYKINEEDGKLVHAIQQGPPGQVMAYQMVRQFCREGFSGVAGMMSLYESFRRALVLSEWFGEPKEDPTPGKPPEAHEKNSSRPTERPTNRSLSGFVDSLLNRSGE